MKIDNIKKYKDKKKLYDYTNTSNNNNIDTNNTFICYTNLI